MHGINFGKQQEPFWTNELRNFISEECNINGGAQGWPYQIDVYSTENQIDWIDGFKILMLSMIKTSDHIPYTKKIQQLSLDQEQKEAERKAKYGN